MALVDTTLDVDKRLQTLRVDAPGKFNGVLERAMKGQGSPRQAIKAKCISCVGVEDVVNRVGGCTCFACPLHAWRPYQSGDESDGE